MPHDSLGLRAELEERESANLRRRLESGSGADSAQGSPVDFRSSDFLCFSTRSELVEAGQAALEKYGSSGRASRLLGGGDKPHHELERLAADWLGTQSSLYFPSGYQANLGLLGALAGRGDAIFSDELNHASLIDGARLSRARIHVYQHFNLEELERALARESRARRRFVVSESIFSMDGDLAPLAELHELCERFDAWLILDEAHAAGLLGPEGNGAWAAEKFTASESQRLLSRLITGGKALGSAGALVAGSQDLIDTLVNNARGFIYTTAPPPSIPATFAKAIELCRASDAERDAALTKAKLLAKQLSLPEPKACILPFHVGDDARCVELGHSLEKQGLQVGAVRPPTVPIGTARLRIAVHADHRDSELEELKSLLPTRAVAPVQVSKPKAPVLFVAGTDTDVGKTIVSALLCLASTRLGPTAYWKPVQTGDDSDTNTVANLAGLEPHQLLRPAFEFPLPASPHEAAADVQREIPPGAVDSALIGLRRTLHDSHLIIELAGGLHVPYRLGADAEIQLDLLERHAPPTVLVARSGLGTLNHTLLSLAALRARHLEPKALFLVGPPHPSNRATLAELGQVEFIYELPHMEPLDTDSLTDWLETTPLDDLFS